MGKTRCPWPGEDPLYIRYHDEEWGVPCHCDRKHFEFLVLESAQAAEKAPAKIVESERVAVAAAEGARSPGQWRLLW